MNKKIEYKYYKNPAVPIVEIIPIEKINELRNAGYVVIPEKDANKIDTINDITLITKTATNLLRDFEIELNNYNMLHEKLSAYFKNDEGFKKFKEGLSAAYEDTLKDAFDFIFTLLKIDYKDSVIYHRALNVKSTN